MSDVLKEKNGLMDSRTYSEEMCWKTIGTPRAIEHVREGALIFKIEPSFSRGATTYRHGLETVKTKRLYLMSDYVKKGVDRETT